MTGRRHQLSVVERKTPVGEVPVQNRKPNLRSIGLARELRLGDKDTADGNAVSATDKDAVFIPYFERVDVAGIV